eukprot:5217594-Lingulodinium_polyedra.AAC.1
MGPLSWSWPGPSRNHRHATLPILLRRSKMPPPLGQMRARRPPQSKTSPQNPCWQRACGIVPPGHQ